MLLQQTCDVLGHSWALVGVYDEKGRLLVPCRRKKCETALRQDGQRMDTVPYVFTNTINGVALDLEDDPVGGAAKIICYEVAYHYDLDSIRFQAGDVVVDVGAHVGIISIYLALKYPGLRIIAIEPTPFNYARLLRNLSANGVTRENVIAINRAVTSDGRPLLLQAKPYENSGSPSAFVKPDRESLTYPVQSMRLRDIFNGYDITRCKLLKMDCEGAEYEIVHGDEGLLDQVDYFRAEAHMNKRLQGLGYNPDRLRQTCYDHMAAENVHVYPAQIAE